MTRGKKASHECLISLQECLIQSVKLGENGDLNMHHKKIERGTAGCPIEKDKHALGNLRRSFNLEVLDIKKLDKIGQSSILFSSLTHIQSRHVDSLYMHVRHKM